MNEVKIDLQNSILMDQLWNKTLDELKMQMTKGMFNLHFAGSFAAGYESQENKLIIVIKNKRSIELIEARLMPKVESTLSAIAGTPMKLSLITQDQNIATLKERKRENLNGQNGSKPAENGQNGTGKNGTTEAKETAVQNSKATIKGKEPTRARAIPNASFLQMSHYAIRFWVPVIGHRAFIIWQTINSLKVGLEFGWNEEPTLKEIMASADISNFTQFKQALQVLSKFGLLHVGERDDNKKSKYLFTISDFPILTFDQHFEYLRDRTINDAHLAWLQRFADRGYFDFAAWRRGADPDQCILINKFAEN